MVDITSERKRAFERLAALAEGLRAQGRSTRSAALKPAIRALYLSEGGFDEHRLGFVSFRGFIEAAAKDGYVSVQKAPFGPDVDVVPAAETVAGSAPRITEPLWRIRRDLWDAFIDWRAEWVRLYDRVDERVGWLPIRESLSEADAVVSLRRAAVADPKRFVPILPIGQDRVLTWMHEFAATLSDPIEQAPVTGALSSAAPMRAFTLVSRATSLHPRWNAFRLDKVRKHIDAWATDHGLALNLQAQKELITSPDRTHERIERSEGSQQLPISAGELRQRINRAVQHMSRAELLRLAIPLEYIFMESDA